jgi:hypothetical protein
MYKALKMNRVDFVELFLDNGFLLRNFVTSRVLLKLYNEVNLTFSTKTFCVLHSKF